MQKKGVFQLIALVLCAMLTFSACSSNSSGGGGGSGKGSTTIGNTYDSPVKLLLAQKNAKKYQSVEDAMVDALNGLYEEEIRDIFKILGKSQVYQEYWDELEDEFEDNLEEFEDKYGSRWKYTYKLEDKDDVKEKDRVAFYREMLVMASSIDSHIAEIENYNDQYWEDYLEELGLSKDEAEDLMEAVKKLGEAIRDSEVEEAYYLQLDITLESDTLDTPENDDYNMYVYKIDGRWVSGDAINRLWYCVDLVR